MHQNGSRLIFDLIKDCVDEEIQGCELFGIFVNVDGHVVGPANHFIMSYLSLLILKFVLLLLEPRLILFDLLRGFHSNFTSQNEGPFYHILVLEDLFVFPRNTDSMLSILIESVPIGDAFLFVLTFQSTQHHDQSNVVVPNHLIEICD